MNLTAKYELFSESGEPHSKTFVVSADVDGYLFEGSGKNKQQVVQKALESLYGINFFASPSKMNKSYSGFSSSFVSFFSQNISK